MNLIVVYREDHKSGLHTIVITLSWRFAEALMESLGVDYGTPCCQMCWHYQQELITMTSRSLHGASFQQSMLGALVTEAERQLQKGLEKLNLSWCYSIGRY